MKVAGTSMRPIWEADSGGERVVRIIDQTQLPFALETADLRSEDDAARAIRDMLVRGAPLIGATAAYGLWLALRVDPGDVSMAAAADRLHATRPTAINLAWALERMKAKLAPVAPSGRADAALEEARTIVEEDVEINRRIGEAGLALIEKAAAGNADGRVSVLTHCNAGWLATCDWGTATAPIYMAHDKGIEVSVLVDETRPRNQGAFLTAWELHNHGVPHRVIVDNAGGHFMQHGEVDLCLVGTDRVTATGDVCNKIGTYLKALAARDNDVPFFVCLPSPTIDWRVRDGVAEIPIEERSPEEVTEMLGRRIVSPGSTAANPAFDVTPARLVTGLVTERGVAEASEAGLRAMFPDLSAGANS